LKTLLTLVAFITLRALDALRSTNIFRGWIRKPTIVSEHEVIPFEIRGVVIATFTIGYRGCSVPEPVGNGDGSDTIDLAYGSCRGGRDGIGDSGIHLRRAYSIDISSSLFLLRGGKGLRAIIFDVTSGKLTEGIKGFLIVFDKVLKLLEAVVSCASTIQEFILQGAYAFFNGLCEFDKGGINLTILLPIVEDEGD
jgi:hypothetical protein